MVRSNFTEMRIRVLALAGLFTFLAPVSAQTGAWTPPVELSTGGFATAVWSDSNGVWTADSPTASKWNPPQVLITGASNPIFVMDSQGDAAVVWTVGGPRSSSSSVMAVLRPAGGVWTSQQIIASGVHVSADHAGISAN